MVVVAVVLVVAVFSSSSNLKPPPVRVGRALPVPPWRHVRAPGLPGLDTTAQSLSRIYAEPSRLARFYY